MKMVLGCQENGAIKIMRLGNYILSVIFDSLIIQKFSLSY